MELIYFIAFVAACGILVFWALQRKDNNKKVDLAQQRKRAEKKAREELLKTPADYTLSHPSQSWHTRRHSASGVVRTNAFAPRSAGVQPEYDGYSRRDRHHVTDVNARIKQEDHVDEATARAAALREGHAAR